MCFSGLGERSKGLVISFRVVEVFVEGEMTKKCSNCYWCHQEEYNPHTGCYAGGKWRKWIPKKQVDIPSECPDWKKDN